MRQLLTNCSFFLVFAASLPCQAVHLVGPGGFADVDAALAVASPGDVVHVAPGEYPTFSVTFPVTIRGLPDAGGGLPLIGANPEVGIDLASGQIAHFVDLQFQQAILTGGRAVFDGCVFQTHFTTMLTVQSASVHLIDCTFELWTLYAFARAVDANDSDVTVVGSSLRGSTSIFTSPAVTLADSRLFGSDSSIRAGTGYPSAVVVTGSSQVWLTDSELVTHPAVCPVQSSGQLVRLDRCTLNGGTSATCPPPTPGTPQLGVAQAAHLSPGQPYDLTFSLEPTGAVFVLAGFELATIDAAPLLAQPSWLAVASAFVDAGLLTDANGQASYGFTLPNDPNLVDAMVWFEGIGFASGGLQVSPVVGGVVR